MMNWSGPPTGVPRTVYCLEKAFRKIYPDMKLVYISDEFNVFHDVKYTQDSPEIGWVTEFAPNNVLLSVGANWAFACYNTNVNYLKTLESISTNYSMTLYPIYILIFMHREQALVTILEIGY